MAKPAKKKFAPGDVATNRQAAFRYTFLDKLECGLVLTGTEVKSLRVNGAVIKDGFASIKDGELWLHNVHIAPYAPASRDNHEPERTRKLLARGKQIDDWVDRSKEKGLTLVPLRIYFKGPKAKVEVALSRGKDQFDKREAIKKRESDRDMQRALREANR